NGVGKSTLLRLCTGELTPTTGTVTRPPDLVYVPQGVTLATGATVAQALGIADSVVALRAVEAGSTDQAHYDAVGDDWAVEERAAAMIAALGLPAMALDRTVGEV